MRSRTIVQGIALFCLITAVSSSVLPEAGERTAIDVAQDAANDVSKALLRIRDILYPRNCADLLEAGQRTSGIYTVFHKTAGRTGQNVYCDMETDGGGWTVIQKRGQYGNSAFYFYRNWTEYANGFGDPDKEYWIGNYALHTLTSGDQVMSLRIFLGNSSDSGIFVDYESVQVDNVQNHFEIHIGKYLGPHGWDAMSSANLSKFSTYDKDLDTSPDHCAEKYKGAWWHTNCYEANLNGLNLNGEHLSKGDGIAWAVPQTIGLNGGYSYPWVRMMIRPAGSWTSRPL
ncbi:techylectin-5A-like [Amblyomma americanum]